MPTFDTPRAISATIDLVLGDVRVSATDDGLTVVDVQPSDASNEKDRKAAEQTRVEYANERLLVKGPKTRSWFSMGGSIDVTVQVPLGTHLHGMAEAADFSCDGRLGDCWIKTGLGRVQLGGANTVRVKCGAGQVGVDHATGHAEITTGSGEVHLRQLDASGAIKNSNGDTWVGVAHGDVRLHAANGDITVGEAHAGVVAKSANGSVRLGDVVSGAAVLETKMGDIDVGIREGVTAWLDVNASAGRVRNELEAADAPESATETVEVRARTSLGEIVIRRP
jgi:Putative adhesin